MSGPDRPTPPGGEEPTDAPGPVRGARVACVVIPLFPLQARLRTEPELFDEAVAVLAGSGTRARVVAATRRARRAGVRPGFTLAQARARLPKLIARPRDADCERAAQEALLDVAESFSPRVEDAGEGVAYLDLAGLHRQYPGGDPERQLAEALQHALDRRARLTARLGVAASKLAARVAAQDADTPTVVAAGDELGFLAPQPLQRLSPQAQTLSTLEQWGIRSLGQLARLPAAEVVSRLGDAGRELHALARGEDPRPLEPRTPPPTFVEGMELEWPLVSLEPFLFVARAALERLTDRMRGHGLGCRRLELSLALEPEGHHDSTFELPAPTRDVKTLLQVLRLHLEAERPGAPILGFTLTAHPDRPRAAQLTLFGPDALSPDKLATTLARLFSILGGDRVGSPRAADAHAPERFELLPFEPPPPPKERPERRPGRGLLTVRLVRPPLPLEVMTEDERPVSLRTLTTGDTARRPSIQGPVHVASGPWSVEQDWWTDRPIERDYWDVELVAGSLGGDRPGGGGLYRIYRNRLTGDWLLDGVYE
ncbi:MAG: DNA polymerase Y family protein [Acidobacteriota bacterium]